MLTELQPSSLKGKNGNVDTSLQKRFDSSSQVKFEVHRRKHEIFLRLLTRWTWRSQEEINLLVEVKFSCYGTCSFAVAGWIIPRYAAKSVNVGTKKLGGFCVSIHGLLRACDTPPMRLQHLSINPFPEWLKWEFFKQVWCERETKSFLCFGYQEKVLSRLHLL